MGHDATKPVFGVSDKARLKPVFLAAETSSSFIKTKMLKDNDIWAATWDFQKCGMCDQQSLRPACAYAQSDQSLC